MSVVIFGANSAIAQKVAEKLAQAGQSLFLAGRNEEQLVKTKQDLTVRYSCQCFSGYFDATAYHDHPRFWQQVLKVLPDVDTVLLAFGYLGSQEKAQTDLAEAEKIIAVNLLGAISILTLVSSYFEQKQKGTIVIISSVAGDRGRQSNYVYGAAKGGLSLFSQGLRQRLAKKGVKVITIKPGFVATPMTYGLDLPKPLVASAEKVAEDIFQALMKGKDVVYTPWYWRPIMGVIKALPESLFKRLNV